MIPKELRCHSLGLLPQCSSAQLNVFQQHRGVRGLLGAGPAYLCRQEAKISVSAQNRFEQVCLPDHRAGFAGRWTDSLRLIVKGFSRFAAIMPACRGVRARSTAVGLASLTVSQSNCVQDKFILSRRGFPVARGRYGTRQVLASESARLLKILCHAPPLVPPPVLAHREDRGTHVRRPGADPLQGFRNGRSIPHIAKVTIDMPQMAIDPSI